MTQRAVIVDSNQIIAEEVTNLIMGTYIGIGAIMYGLYWVVGYFTPRLLHDDLGILVYLMVPAAILLCAFLLLIVLFCAISFEDPISQIAYSCGISYLCVPMIRDAGWIGYADTGKVISYILIFFIAIGLIRKLMKYSKVLKTTKIIGGLTIFGILTIGFLDTTVKIIYSAGWIHMSPDDCYVYAPFAINVCNLIN